MINLELSILMESLDTRHKTEEQQEEFWNSLSKEDQLKAFCAISRRIYKGEIENKSTYRYVLYDIFGFDHDSYSKAIDAGFFAIHNSIMSIQDEEDMLKQFAKKNGIDDNAVNDFMSERYF